MLFAFSGYKETAGEQCSISSNVIFLIGDIIIVQRGCHTVNFSTSSVNLSLSSVIRFVQWHFILIISTNRCEMKFLSPWKLGLFWKVEPSIPIISSSINIVISWKVRKKMKVDSATCRRSMHEYFDSWQERKTCMKFSQLKREENLNDFFIGGRQNMYWPTLESMQTFLVTVPHRYQVNDKTIPPGESWQSTKKLGIRIEEWSPNTPPKP